MSDDHKENITPLEAQSSESTTGSGGSIKDIDYVRPAEVADQDLYHGHSFITKWIFCQDAKVIGVTIFSYCSIYRHSWTYSFMVNAFTIRFSRTSSIYYSRTLLPVCNHAWNDNGCVFF